MVRDREGVLGDYVNIPSKNEDFGAELESGVSDLESDHLRRVDIGRRLHGAHLLHGTVHRGTSAPLPLQSPDDGSWLKMSRAEERTPPCFAGFTMLIHDAQQ